MGLAINGVPPYYMIMVEGNTKMQTEVKMMPIRQEPRSRFRTKSRVYVWPKNESVIENFVNRRSRPLNLYRQALREGLSNAGVDLSNVDYRWSQKAGCSCGCSPGFIVDGYDPVLYGKDVHIELTEV